MLLRMFCCSAEPRPIGGAQLRHIKSRRGWGGADAGRKKNRQDGLMVRSKQEESDVPTVTHRFDKIVIRPGFCFIKQVQQTLSLILNSEIENSEFPVPETLI